MDKREPAIIEGAKIVLFMKSTSSNQIMNDILKDLYSLKKPEAVLFSKKNDIHPFDDPKPLEFYSLKNQAGLIVISSHSKKRPHNMVLCRMFDHQLLDMVELGVTNMALMDEFKKSASLGFKPCVLFNGDLWETSDELKTAKSILADLFCGDKTADHIDLEGLTHSIFVTAVDQDNATRIYVRTHAIQLKKSGTKCPRVELEEMGPHMDFELRRVRNAESSLMKEALRIPKEAKVIHSISSDSD